MRWLLPILAMTSAGVLGLAIGAGAIDQGLVCTSNRTMTICSRAVFQEPRMGEVALAVLFVCVLVALCVVIIEARRCRKG